MLEPGEYSADFRHVSPRPGTTLSFGCLFFGHLFNKKERQIMWKNKRFP
jgi:hypothetical protein